MRADDLLFWNQAAPFAPYRIRLNSGRTFDIRHPKMIRIGRTAVVLFTYAGDPSSPFEKVEMISLVLIESIEPISTPYAAT